MAKKKKRKETVTKNKDYLVEIGYDNDEVEIL